MIPVMMHKQDKALQQPQGFADRQKLASVAQLPAGGGVSNAQMSCMKNYFAFSEKN